VDTSAHAASRNRAGERENIAGVISRQQPDQRRIDAIALDPFAADLGEGTNHMRKRMHALLYSFVLGLPLLSGTLASAATFTVNRTTDEPDANPGDGACRTTRDKCTLRAAIQESNALPGQDQVHLPQGHYQLTIPGGNEDAAMSADLDVTDDLVLIGSGADKTQIVS
jgi:CSLREA domain-containing protein